MNWNRTAGSPTQPITAHQFTRVLIITTCKLSDHSSTSTHKHQHQSTSSSSLIGLTHWFSPLSSLLLIHSLNFCVIPSLLSSSSVLLIAYLSSSTQSRIPRGGIRPPAPVQDSPRWFHPRSPGTEGYHQSDLLITHRSFIIPIFIIPHLPHLLPAVHLVTVNKRH